MKKKHTLNQKRLSKNEIKSLIESGVVLHQGYTESFLEVYPSGHEVHNLIYELPDKNFLFVVGANSPLSPNKGDIYPEEYLKRLIRGKERLNNDIKLGITSSVRKWRYYSKMGNHLIENIEQMITSLSQKLDIALPKLDKSYPSLSLVDAALNKLDLDYIFAHLYDELVAYVGEVIIKRVKGTWDINQNFAGGDYPYISIGLKRVQYMPLNAVFSSLNEIEEVNLRLETANEIRAQAGRASYEKGKDLSALS